MQGSVLLGILRENSCSFSNCRAVFLAHLGFGTFFYEASSTFIMSQVTLLLFFSQTSPCLLLIRTSMVTFRTRRYNHLGSISKLNYICKVSLTTHNECSQHSLEGSRTRYLWGSLLFDFFSFLVV